MSIFDRQPFRIASRENVPFVSSQTGPNFKATFFWMSVLAASTTLIVIGETIGFKPLHDKEHAFYDTMRVLHVVANVLTLIAAEAVVYGAGYFANKCVVRPEVTGILSLEDARLEYSDEEDSCHEGSELEVQNKIKTMLAPKARPSRWNICKPSWPPGPHQTGLFFALLATGTVAVAVGVKVGFKTMWTTFMHSDYTHYIALGELVALSIAAVSGTGVGAHWVKDAIKAKCCRASEDSGVSVPLLGDDASNYGATGEGDDPALYI